MAAPIRADQIKQAEQVLQAHMAKYPKLADAVKAGKIRWVVVPGDSVSQLLMIDDQDPRFYSDGAYQTPQEAEHFTAGFGNEPTIEGSGRRIINRAIRPHSQYQDYDPIRKYQHSKGADAVQDVLSGARYGAGVVGAMLPGSPLGAALATAGGVAGMAGANNYISDVRGEPQYKETPAQLLANAALAGMAAHNWKYFSEDATKKRQLNKAISRNLGVKPRDFDKGLVDEIERRLADQSPNGPDVFRVKDWQDWPLTQFDATTGAPQMGVHFEGLPPVKVVGGGQIAPRKPSAGIKDEQAIQYLKDLGIPRHDFHLNDVKDAIYDAWALPMSDEGSVMYPRKGNEPFTKEQWAIRRASETNPFKAHLYSNYAHLDDQQMDAQWHAARKETERRRKKAPNKKRAVVTRDAYANMGDYKMNLPFYTGKLRQQFGWRGPTRAITTIAPIVAQALLPYIVKEVEDAEE